MLPYFELEQHLKDAVQAVLPSADLSNVQVRPCPDPRFGDYQSAALIPLAKTHRLNPRELANQVAARLQTATTSAQIEVAGPGFINFRLHPEAVSRSLLSAVAAGPLFFQPAARPQTVVVDFSSPNVAKPMHVGHIRSTVLGDCLARTFRLLGHRVITDNHIGDWGTQFGKLLVGWKKHLEPAALAADPIAEMERLYRWVNQACEQNPAVLEEARQELVKLQSGNEENRKIWEEMLRLSAKQFEQLYSRLGTHFDYTLGESFYNPQLPQVVKSLTSAGLAKESEGALAVFFEDVPELKRQPALIQKSDGGYNYTTTDLATLEYRLQQWHPDQILYVTDGRQQLHFKQLFTIFRRWHPEAKVILQHVWFGAILGEDGRPFKTRSGDTIRLSELLDEAEERAFQVVSAKSPDLPEEQRRDVARVVGIGAVKYADLLPNRQTDYVFSWDKMLALNGNTAPYLLYAYTRIRSIFRKAEQESMEVTPPQSIPITAEAELALGKHLLNFGLILQAVAEEYRPNYLCNYLYELAGKFTSFYESCPVLKAEPEQRAARLALCDLTGRVLKQGLEVLGLETLEKM